MPDLVDRLSKQVRKKLTALRVGEPTEAALNGMLRIVYLASMKTEEGRFVTGSLTFASRHRPDVHPPELQRADYPTISSFPRPEPLNVERLVKLSRGIDRWAGSIAVYGTTRSNLSAWGVLDQLVQLNIRRNRESETGFCTLGTLTVTIDGIGDLSVYHGDLFLGSIRAQEIVVREEDALWSQMVRDRITPELTAPAKQIVRFLRKVSGSVIEFGLFSTWETTVARLCIGLQRLGTGGSFLITPHPQQKGLKIGHPFHYTRIEESMILGQLVGIYANLLIEDEREARQSSGHVPADLFRRAMFATSDNEDRECELTGAVKLVTSLAAMDGLVLLSPTLTVMGFGVKIGTAPSVTTVYDGLDFSRRGTKARRVDVSRFGTRHSSMLRYCKLDRRAIGLVVSQDRHVRLIMSVGRSVVMWENVKLLGYESYSAGAARNHRSRLIRGRRRKTASFGFSDTPKTLGALLRGRWGGRQPHTQDS